MNEDFVTYEQAVQLRELGFDWKCNHYYHLYDELPTLSVLSEYENSNKFDKNWSAPTLAQAQKWLREVKQVKILITVGDVNENRYGWQIFYNNNHYVDLNHGNSIETYEEALSDSITEALELLKEKK